MSDKKALAALQSALEAEQSTWTAGSNPIYELSDAEQDRLLGYTPGPDEPSLVEQENIAMNNFVAFKAMMTSMKSTDEGIMAPSAFDWRSHGGQNYVTPIRNQGGCGSCVAFGAVAAVETRYKVQKGAAAAVDHSEAHLFYCHARGEGRHCGNGWWPNRALEHYKNNGVVDEACYPYTDQDQNCSGRCADWQNRLTKIKGYTRLTSIQAMKDWLSTKGALVACYTVYTDFMAYRSGVYRKSANPGAVRGGHCVCAIGYSDSQQAWICKNSWGTGWGEGGYFRIGYGQVGIDSEMYGIDEVDMSGWIRNAAVRGLWSNSAARNAWVYLGNDGWKKISDSNDTNFYLMLTQLAAAKTARRNVTVYVNSHNIITEVYA
jgi:C1A family cysteine protease